MSPGRDSEVPGASPAARVCWTFTRTCPSHALSGFSAVAAGAAPSGSRHFPNLHIVAREMVCWEAQSYFTEEKKSQV